MLAHHAIVSAPFYIHLCWLPHRQHIVYKYKYHRTTTIHYMHVECSCRVQHSQDTHTHTVANNRFIPATTIRRTLCTYHGNVHQDELYGTSQCQAYYYTLVDAGMVVAVYAVVRSIFHCASENRAYTEKCGIGDNAPTPQSP